jgi:hypothetical protein
MAVSCCPIFSMATTPASCCCSDRTSRAVAFSCARITLCSCVDSESSSGVTCSDRIASPSSTASSAAAGSHLQSRRKERENMGEREEIYQGH